MPAAFLNVSYSVFLPVTNELSYPLVWVNSSTLQGSLLSLQGQTILLNSSVTVLSMVMCLGSSLMLTSVVAALTPNSPPNPWAMKMPADKSDFSQKTSSSSSGVGVASTGPTWKDGVSFVRICRGSLQSLGDLPNASYLLPSTSSMLWRFSSSANSIWSFIFCMDCMSFNLSLYLTQSVAILLAKYTK